ncbi:hypothetical protein BH23PLA1_BH23PLA1_21470 [soil metagenome]
MDQLTQAVISSLATLVLLACGPGLPRGRSLCPGTVGIVNKDALLMYQFFNILMSPFLVLVVLALLAQANLWRRRPEGRRRLILAALPLIGLWILCTPAFGHLAFGTLEWQVSAADARQAEKNAEAIIVLGGYVLPADADRPRPLLGPDSLYRCFHAAELYRRIGPCPVIVSGGKVDPDGPGPAIAPVLVEFLITQGVDPADLILEDRSRSTHENAVECARVLQSLGFNKKIALVTEAFHMPRALACFQKQGVHALAAPCHRRAASFEPALAAFLPQPTTPRGGQQVFHEWLGLAWYKFQGRI